MSDNPSLAAYVVTFNVTNARALLPMRRGQTDCFFSLVQDCIKSWGASPVKARFTKSATRVHHLKTMPGLDVDTATGRIAGLFEYGFSGRQGTIYNSNYKKPRIRRANHPDLEPFFFLLDIPDDPSETVALLITEQRGVAGFKTIFSRGLRTYFARLGYHAYVETLTDAELLRYWFENGIADGVEVSAVAKRGDSRKMIAGSALGKTGVRPGTRIKVSMRNKHMPWRTLLRRYMHDPVATTKLIKIAGLEDPDAISVNVRVGADEKKFNLMRLHGHPATLELEKVQVDPKTKHPLYASIKSFANDYATQLRKQRA